MSVFPGLTTYFAGHLFKCGWESLTYTCPQPNTAFPEASLHEANRRCPESRVMQTVTTLCRQCIVVPQCPLSSPCRVLQLTTKATVPSRLDIQYLPCHVSPKLHFFSDALGHELSDESSACPSSMFLPSQWHMWFHLRPPLNPSLSSSFH